MQWWKFATTRKDKGHATPVTVSRGAALVTACALLSGCMSYVPTELGAVPEGQDVRVYVTRQALVDLTEISLESGPQIKGTLIRHDDEQILLRIPVAMRQEGFHQTRLAQDVRIPTNQVLQVERRELNRAGTGLLVAGGALAAAGIISLILRDAHGEPGQPPGDSNEIRVPSFFFSVPVP